MICEPGSAVFHMEVAVQDDTMMVDHLRKGSRRAVDNGVDHFYGCVVRIYTYVNTHTPNTDI